MNRLSFVYVTPILLSRSLPGKHCNLQQYIKEKQTMSPINKPYVKHRFVSVQERGYEKMDWIQLQTPARPYTAKVFNLELQNSPNLNREHVEELARKNL